MKTTYSVEIAQNSYNDDLFNGSYDECIDYIKSNGYTSEENDVRIACIQVDGTTVTNVLDVIFPKISKGE